MGDVLKGPLAASEDGDPSGRKIDFRVLQADGHKRAEVLLREVGKEKIEAGTSGTVLQVHIRGTGRAVPLFLVRFGFQWRAGQ